MGMGRETAYSVVMTAYTNNRDDSYIFSWLAAVTTLPGVINPAGYLRRMVTENNEPPCVKDYQQTARTNQPQETKKPKAKGGGGINFEKWTRFFTGASQNSVETTVEVPAAPISEIAVESVTSPLDMLPLYLKSELRALAREDNINIRKATLTGQILEVSFYGLYQLDEGMLKKWQVRLSYQGVSEIRQLG